LRRKERVPQREEDEERYGSGFDDEEDITPKVGIGGVGRPRGVRHERGPRRNTMG
jgi:hypothetical protein